MLSRESLERSHRLWCGVAETGGKESAFERDLRALALRSLRMDDAIRKAMTRATGDMLSVSDCERYADDLCEEHPSDEALTWGFEALRAIAEAMRQEQMGDL